MFSGSGFVWIGDFGEEFSLEGRAFEAGSDVPQPSREDFA